MVNASGISLIVMPTLLNGCDRGAGFVLDSKCRILRPLHEEQYGKRYIESRLVYMAYTGSSIGRAQDNSLQLDLNHYTSLSTTT